MIIIEAKCLLLWMFLQLIIRVPVCWSFTIWDLNLGHKLRILTHSNLVYFSHIEKFVSLVIHTSSVTVVPRKILHFFRSLTSLTLLLVFCSPFDPGLVHWKKERKFLILNVSQSQCKNHISKHSKIYGHISTLVVMLILYLLILLEFFRKSQGKNCFEGKWRRMHRRLGY